MGEESPPPAQQPDMPHDDTREQRARQAVSQARLRWYRLSGKTEDIVEHYIEEAKQSGEWERVVQAGKGKPLRWLQEPENPFVPDEQRLAYQVLADAGFAPEWIEVERELRRTLAAAEHHAQRHIAWLRSAARHRRHPAGSLSELLLLDPSAAAAHDRALARYRQFFQQANELIKRYNSLAPEAQERLRLYRPDDEAQQLEQRCRTTLRQD